MHFGTLSHVYSVKHFEVARQQTHHQRLAPLPQNFSLDCSTVHHCLNRFWYREGRRIVCTCLSYTLCFLSSILLLAMWKNFFFNNRELCTSCYYRFISDQLLVLPARRLSLSLKPTQAFLFFQLIELSDFLFVSELVSLSARDSRNSLWRKWVPSDPSLCTTWFVTIYYALNVSEDSDLLVFSGNLSCLCCRDIATLEIFHWNI